MLPIMLLGGFQTLSYQRDILLCGLDTALRLLLKRMEHIHHTRQLHRVDPAIGIGVIVGHNL